MLLFLALLRTPLLGRGATGPGRAAWDLHPSGRWEGTCPLPPAATREPDKHCLWVTNVKKQVKFKLILV